MSESPVAVDEIARLTRHSSSPMTKTIYRDKLRPVTTAGTDVTGKIFIKPSAPVCGVSPYRYARS